MIALVEKSKKLGDIPNLKKLSGYKLSFRMRIAGDRVGGFLEKGTIILARIVHRKDVYKLFP
jgi:mRNA interferase RelE/StbE